MGQVNKGKARRRINESQSADSDSARSRALKRFETARDDRLTRKKELMETIDRQSELIHFALSLLQFDDYADLLEKEKRTLCEACFSLGKIIAKMESFEWVMKMWSKGIIKKERFLEETIKDLHLDSKADITEITELTDLFFGSGYDLEPRFGKGIPEATKRQYRNTLKARIMARKT